MPAPWPDAQAAFAAALTDAQLPAPAGLVVNGASGPQRGFAVHRNNHVVGLIGALQERFPVTLRLVGREFFRAMARTYVAAHRPRSPLLMSYGDDFPDFIARFGPAESVPYLSDVARLEVAWNQAYHAAEAAPLDASALSSVPGESRLEARLSLHPSVRLLRSAWPVAEIWSAHQGPGEVAPPAEWRPQDVLVVRPDADVQVVALPPGVHAFLHAILERNTVQEAGGLAVQDSADFDLGDSVVMLFRIGAIAAIDRRDIPELST